MLIKINYYLIAAIFVKKSICFLLEMFCGCEEYLSVSIYLESVKELFEKVISFAFPPAVSDIFKQMLTPFFGLLKNCFTFSF